uniref:UPF0462 protein C4orf33 homolog n=1 Tax=Terrapene triunguis TaxID=2587831 RepID=A0A674JDT9_9SAUR
MLEYKITNTWDSIKVMHEPVIIRFKAGDHGLIMEVNSLFFDDPSAPSGEPGKPFDGLWDYEVVESFFLNSETKDYLEVELCPHRLEYFKRFSLKWIMGENWEQPASDLWK